MTLFQFVAVCTGIIFVLFTIDLYQRQKFNFLHFLVFFGGTAGVVVAGIRPDLLDKFGKFFGVASGSDLIVYGAIMFLAYLYFELIHKHTRHQMELTRLTTASALRAYSLAYPLTVLPPVTSPKDAYLFLIRAYNEATMIGEVIDEIIGVGFMKIVVCDDGSKDMTESIVLQKKLQYPDAHIICLHHLINRGPGAANKTLFAFASMYAPSLGTERCVTYDADGQMSIADMEVFMRHADHSKYDIVIGSRFVEGSVVENMPRLRRVILLGGRVVTWIFNGIWITDVPTGYRMYHHSILPKINITSDRFSYQNEIIGAISRHHLRYTEIPVHIKYTEYSLSKGQSNMSAFKILKELIYKTLFFR